ncbi:MAG: hypothetical protein PWP22_1017, partial [Thermoanaerobacter sp.]|nr:hypothetical protein [Thermoanaerobacter sp.]
FTLSVQFDKICTIHKKGIKGDAL